MRLFIRAITEKGEVVLKDVYYKFCTDNFDWKTKMLLKATGDIRFEIINENPYTLEMINRFFIQVSPTNKVKREIRIKMIDMMKSNATIDVDYEVIFK